MAPLWVWHEVLAVSCAPALGLGHISVLREVWELGSQRQEEESSGSLKALARDSQNVPSAHLLGGDKLQLLL